jgi:hypothetical protein
MAILSVLLVLSPLAAAIQFNGGDSEVTLLPEGYSPELAAEVEFVSKVESAASDLAGCGVDENIVFSLGGDAVYAGNFAIDLARVNCDEYADPPCLLRETKGRPFLPTGVIADPIRQHYSHLETSLRYDVIHSSQASASREPGAFVAYRSLLSLTNPTHVTRHVDVILGESFTEDILHFESDRDHPHYQIREAGSNIFFAHHYSPCTKNSHHFEVKAVNSAFEQSCTSSERVFATEAKVMVHPGETVIVATVVEMFNNDDLTIARLRAKDVDERSDRADVHWFADLTDKERRAIVNYCVDDDDGEAGDDDDSSSSSSSDSTITTSKIDGGKFAFKFHSHKCDNPLYNAKERRYRGKLSDDFTSSELFDTTVERVKTSTYSSSSSSSSDHAVPVPVNP